MKNGSIVCRHHFNLQGEYDFSDDYLKDSHYDQLSIFYKCGNSHIPLILWGILRNQFHMHHEEVDALIFFDTIAQGD
jgi:hypothetical protein